MNVENMKKEHIVQLKKGELFLAIAAQQMENKEDLLQEYFGIVFPPAQKNGFTPLGQLPIKEVATGNYMPNGFIGLFKWPNMESVQQFLGEVSPEKLNELRVNIWSELKQHMVVVPENMNITFKEDKVYEVKMLWNENMLNTDIIKKNNGSILIHTSIAGYEDLGKNKAPNTLMIVEWNSLNDAKKVRNMKPLSVEKEEAFYTHFSFPEQK